MDLRFVEGLFNRCNISPVSAGPTLPGSRILQNSVGITTPTLVIISHLILLAKLQERFLGVPQPRLLCDVYSTYARYYLIDPCSLLPAPSELASDAIYCLFKRWVLVGIFLL